MEVDKDKLRQIVMQHSSLKDANGINDYMNVEEFKLELSRLLVKGERDRVSEALALYIKDKHTFKSIRNDDKKEVWVYCDGIYIPNGITYIEQDCRFILEQLYTTNMANRVISKIHTDTYIEQPDFFNKHEEDTYLLPVDNGILNLKTKKLIDFSPNYYFFTKLDIEYKENATCQRIIKFIKEITNNEDDVKLIQEMFGFCLLKDYKYEKAFMLYGEHGRNGKSKLLELLKLMINPKNICGLSLKDIETNDFCISQLHGKLVNIGGDISNYSLKDTSKFKSLTGRDLIDADRKHKTRLYFKSYAKMIFACNNLPIPTEDSDAFWLRWVLIEFPYQFLPQKEISVFDGENNSSIKLQEPSIIEKLSIKSELEGLLVWSIIGLDRLEKNKDFSNKATMKEIKTKWQRKSNSVSAFIQDEIIYSYGDNITKSDFRQSYNEYCTKHRIKKLGDKVIVITLQNKLGISSDYIYDGSKKIYIWENIRFKSLSFKKMVMDKYNIYEGAEIKEQDLYKLFSENKYNDTEIKNKINDLLMSGKIIKKDLTTYKIM